MSKKISSLLFGGLMSCMVFGQISDSGLVAYYTFDSNAGILARKKILLE